ncbi:MocR-like pyridoxine biosynthesis transcription factor PdxR [Janthinobacterium agaricidamnosum]|uniref:Bacterial regulatory s, gntR family protein n=1 Tax=Janthinobacterium agaricidamnosum NBRC 102515 = DSM 9628 TaxID=1349767 RepID=W0VBZ2_9BURK|nr:PLP-dependent aminotransferase family protein [Janthinobacterium agaricidamnosum]CDG85406.1 bacterial regulatory s, gntR family protein [Janthinobacterium agaricidamnosum NBRC 102515 = DSM 9628]
MQAKQFLSTLTIDRHHPAPLFRQLYTALKEAILAGAIGPGMQLPPTREFCRLLSISRQTVLNAYAQLMAEGYLTGSVGKGTFVSGDLPLAEKTPAAPGLLRPLSRRGEEVAAAMSQVAYHGSKLRAFRVGMPAIEHFPFDVWSRLETRRRRRSPAHLMGYSDPAGYLPLRELLCVYLKAARGVDCTAQQIIITSGSQQALFLLSTILLGPGDAAWMESPGYRGASAPLHACGAHVFPVPVDEQGLNVAYGAAFCPHAKLAYVTPSHQLPLGVTMSLQRRLELLAWAAQAKAWVIEDDYDSEYRYTGAPLASLQSLDRNGCVIYVGTLSKVLFPGLRLGYMVAPPALAGALVQAKAVIDRHTAIVPQMALADFIAEGHFGRHIKRTRDLNASRRDLLLRGIARELDDQLRCGPADSGLELSVFFRQGRDEQRVAAQGLERGIELRPLSNYVGPGAPAECRAAPGLLLGFAMLDEAEMNHGLAVLSSVLRGR